MRKKSVVSAFLKSGCEESKSQGQPAVVLLQIIPYTVGPFPEVLCVDLLTLAA